MPLRALSEQAEWRGAQREVALPQPAVGPVVPRACTPALAGVPGQPALWDLVWGQGPRRGRRKW